jgi:hypothetical protein
MYVSGVVGTVMLGQGGAAGAAAAAGTSSSAGAGGAGGGLNAVIDQAQVSLSQTGLSEKASR